MSRFTAKLCTPAREACARLRCLPPADQKLLRWVLLCMIVLLGTGLLMVTGGFTPAAEMQVELLLGRPFYLEAEAVQVSLLSPGATFGICTGLTLYFALLLPNLAGAAARTQVCFATAVALLLPAGIGTLWHGVLYVAPFLFCVALLWLLTFIPYFHRKHFS